MKPLRLLLVDDEVPVLMTLAASLELEGLEVVTAGNGGNALSLLQQQDFDLVLSDVRMPGMNGVELFRAIRKVRADLPVVLMTAFALESLLAEALSEGAFTVLSKPFDIEEILQTLVIAARRPTALIIDGPGDGAGDGNGPPQDAVAVLAALREMGLSARAGFDEHSSLRAVNDDTVDVCVIDLTMAASGQPPLLDRLKELDPQISFIALANRDVPEMVRKVYASTPMGWVRKPVSPPLLAQSIASARRRPPRPKATP